ncbi:MULTISPECIES: hypothetical protein [unclassified Xanthobacter]|uniref:hypothetical protein n=1 Tax=unclassified Xanthobacter TaxID=2623496 RepID=UPI001F23EECE|nr:MULTISPECIES: hypothetical protein [unclassified Xanthobacter]
MTPTTIIIRNEHGAETARWHVDHDQQEHRQFMGKTSFWALRHSHSMESLPGWVGAGRRRDVGGAPASEPASN